MYNIFFYIKTKHVQLYTYPLKIPLLLRIANNLGNSIMSIHTRYFFVPILERKKKTCKKKYDEIFMNLPNFADFL